MKALRLVVAAIGIWGLALLWPQLNALLTLPVVLAFAAGWGARDLSQLGGRLLGHESRLSQAGHDRPTRPIPVAVAR